MFTRFLSDRVPFFRGRETGSDIMRTADLKQKTPSDKRRFTIVAPRVGFEPTTYRLTADCSTIELSGIIYLRAKL